MQTAKDPTVVANERHEAREGFQQELNKRNTQTVWDLIKDLQSKYESQQALIVEQNKAITTLRSEVESLKQNITMNLLMNRGSGPTS